MSSGVIIDENHPHHHILMPFKAVGSAVTKVVHRCQDAKEDQKLDLSECQLMQIPDAIYMLMRNTNLVLCNLSSNVLRKIPPKFAYKFTNITELNLSHNQLSSLPDEMCDLSELRKLDVSHNHFLDLPRVVFRLAKLTHLFANKNYISELNTERLVDMSALQFADFTDNPITEETHDAVASATSFKRNDLEIKLPERSPEDDMLLESDFKNLI